MNYTELFGYNVDMIFLELFLYFVLFTYRRSVRSGYAFAHQEGFGRLITSGRMMRQPHHTTFQQVKNGGFFMMIDMITVFENNSKCRI